MFVRRVLARQGEVGRRTDRVLRGPAPEDGSRRREPHAPGVTFGWVALSESDATGGAGRLPGPASWPALTAIERRRSQSERPRSRRERATREDRPPLH